MRSRLPNARPRPLPFGGWWALGASLLLAWWSAPALAAADPIAAPKADDNDAEPEEEVEDPTAGRWGIAAVPKFTVDSDNGIGLGVRGNAYWYRWDQQPYKTAIGFQAFVTTKLVQHHYLFVDAIDAFNLPLRLKGEVGYFQSRSQNFCGFGNATTCDPAVIDRQAADLGLDPVERGLLRQSYYRVRFLRPYANAQVRWRLNQKPHEISVFGGWRGHYYIPGDLVDENKDGAIDLFPYPNSLYAARFPQGERGLASVLQVGAMVDNRDNEPAPRRGYWIEASIRGATPFWGSTWTYAGVNTTARFYIPLLSDDVILASRYVLDLTVGDLPLQEMIRVGGTRDYTAFGGAQFGRGIRVQRYPGRIKAMMQQEVRWELPDFDLWSQNIRFGFAGFFDAGWIGHDWNIPTSPSGQSPQGFGGDPSRVAIGGGVSLRFTWNRNFVMRLDIAFSPDERYVPQVYSGPNHPY